MYPIPPRLLAFQETIVAGDPDAQIIHYSAVTWERQFATDPDFITLAVRFPEQISRHDLFLLSQETMADSIGPRQLFLAAMIWGFGKVGYGPYRTKQMLAIPDSVSLLAQATKALRVGRLAEAYTALRLPLCGPPFLTKFLYSVAIGASLNPLPLVLDSRVAGSLQFLVGDAELPTDYYAKGAGSVRHLTGYLRYIEHMHEWAQQLGCRADAIELFLFQPPQTFYDWQPTGNRK